jgi:hypothetical protein
MLPGGVLLAYVVVLAISGVLMLVFGGIGFRQGIGARVVEVLVGVAFVAYAVYLVFFFTGGRVSFSFWTLLGPALAVANIVRSRRTHRIKEEQLAATYAAEAQQRAGYR